MVLRKKIVDPEAIQESDLEVCGIVMPISAIDGCGEDHWRDVKGVISEAIEDAGFDPQLVSDADDVGIIQKRIIQNLYANPVVVCDVSAKNPNVMFELGMRLAFDRPTIIVKDDKTSYSFDTSPVEHLSYPRDLRFSKIVEFKIALAEKIKATYEKSKSDPTYTTFLKHFGSFKVAEIKTKVVPQDRLVLEEIRNLREVVTSMTSSLRAQGSVRNSGGPPRSTETLCVMEPTAEVVEKISDALVKTGARFSRSDTVSGHTHWEIFEATPVLLTQILEKAREFNPEARILNSTNRRRIVTAA